MLDKPFIARWTLAVTLLALSACSVNPPPATATLAVATPARVQTATMPVPTTLLPTPTSTQTPTPTSTTTATATRTPSATPSLTLTPPPTRVPRTPTATTLPAIPTPTTSSVIPAPPVDAFTADRLVEDLTHAHYTFQSFVEDAGKVLERGGGAFCRSLTAYWDQWVHLRVFNNVPEAWQRLYADYRSLLNKGIITTLPIISVCQQGGGQVDEATVRNIVDTCDSIQNQLYSLLQEAKALKGN